MTDNYKIKDLLKNRISVLFILLFIAFSFTLIFSRIVLPELFRLWNRQINDKLFVIRYKLKGKEPVDPAITNIVLNDSDTKILGINSWDRQKLAETLAFLCQSNVNAVACDMLFLEKSFHKNDRQLISAANNCPNLYFPVVLVTDKNKQQMFTGSNQQVYNQSTWHPHIIKQGRPYSASIRFAPFSELVSAARGLGHINIITDNDGMSRSFPLIYQIQDIKNVYVPSLTFRLICDFLNVNSDNIKIAFGSNIVLPNATLPGGIIKDISIPIDHKGCVLINWTGPWDDSFTRYTLSSLQQKMRNPEQTSQLKEAMTDLLVIFSDISTRNNDYGPGIFNNVYPLSGIHATIANMILTENFVQYLNTFQEILLFILFIILFMLMSVKIKTYRLLIASTLLFSFFIGLHIFMFLIFNVLGHPINFLIGYILSLFISFTYQLFVDEKKKIQWLMQKKIEKEKKQYTSYISHELKSPLTLILGNLSLILQKKQDEVSNDVLDKLNGIKSDTHDLHSLLEQFSDLSQLESGNLKLNISKIDFDYFIKQIGSVFSLSAAEKNISFRIRSTTKPVFLYLDIYKVYRALIYIVQNSLHFTPAKGQISLSIKLANNQQKKADKNIQKALIIRIHDSGPAIPEQTLSQLFTTFNHTSGCHSRIYSQEGIRLFLAKELIELHKGLFQIHNKKEKGLEFVITFFTGQKHFDQDRIISREPIDRTIIQNIISGFPINNYFIKQKSPRNKGKISNVIKNKDKGKIGTILIIENNFRLQAYIRELLENKYLIIEAPNGTEALEKCKRTEIDLMICDENLPDMTGFSLLEVLKKNKTTKNIPFILMTTNQTSNLKKNRKIKPDEFLCKPFNSQELFIRINNVLTVNEQRKKLDQLNKKIIDIKLNNPAAFANIITCSESMHKIFKKIELIAKSPKEVLITGESGTGKELIAEAIHKTSQIQGKFVLVNIAGLDDTLFSDTLFGHCKGAYTGAESVRSGLIEKANGGTLFLDEIGDLSLQSQTKLLRLLQEKTYYQLGSDEEKKADVRIIAATNVNLKQKRNKNEIREDLYYRLISHNIHLPPLRERKDDLPLLTDFFIRETSRKLGKKAPVIPKELNILLSNYHFPGNIRELQALIFHALSQNENKILSLEFFKEFMHQHKQAEKTNILWNINNQNQITFNGLFSLKEMENIYIKEVLKKTNGSLTMAAKHLGLHVSSLSRRIKKNKYFV